MPTGAAWPGCRPPFPRPPTPHATAAACCGCRRCCRCAAPTCWPCTNWRAPAFERHGFDLFATFSMINERTLGGVLTVAYDKHDPHEAARARACHDEVFGRMFDAGYIPYRVGNHAMGRLDPGSDSYWRTVARKGALDPLGTLAPGRYEPARAGG
ncbi:hypothetical protein G4G28_12310 [Massilia sp. Dwa41.01b]|uniref:hypothetical protein n=1 Tax=Massilia sp. Dwa41.01b TaxID=2709302 RepID=UPI0015FF4C5F|nr:hypothetical protein [Massilia sp. Dwa41.01b]QNA89064.1 hypothetical protein G4G28_12310 [Massilia sp. Dwa41.01b]